MDEWERISSWNVQVIDCSTVVMFKTEMTALWYDGDEISCFVCIIEIDILYMIMYR